MRRKIRRLSYIVLLLVLEAVACMSCVAVHDDEPQVAEACSVLRTADSLRALGVLIDDSTALAHAVTLLGKHPRRHADDYMRACYYYGCLLRSRNNYTAAMQTFIHAAHTETTRHDIKGRVYSNMGSLCQIAEDFEMSHKMYSLSAEQFLAAKDTTAYYYARNSMAFELAEQKKKSETLALLGSIETDCTDADVLCLVAMTKAVLYRNFEQYDSAVYYAGRELLFRPDEHMGLMVKAQSFSLLGMKDSAVFYARKVTEHSPSWSEQTNAYYILSNDDETLSKEDALKIASDRADAQKMLETQRSRLAQAVLLLRQDMDRRPDYRWLYTAIIIILLLTVWLAGHVITRKKHAAEKRKRQEEIARHNLYMQQTEEAIEQNRMQIEETRQAIEAQNKQAETVLAETENTCSIMRQCQDIKTQLCWNDYGQMCRVINKQFCLLADRLGKTDGIHETDIRLCVLVLIGYSHEAIADIMPCSPNSVKTLKRRTAHKLGTNSRDLRMFLLKMAANMPV
ncbi:MAG: hypothetical protein K5660_09445 [Paludibacteraceae bacterium]|nr:hypothetical protein [Paludibacteraceae bacterium]